jgi:hypothetical protein
MGRKLLFLYCATFVWLVTAIFADAASPPIAFSYVTLDYPGAHDTQLNGINGGKIVGDWETNSSTLFPNSFLYDGASFKSIAFPGADPNLGTQAFGISGNLIAGIYWTPSPNIHEHGFLYDGNSYTTIDDPLANSFYANQGGVFGISGNHLVGEYIDSASHGQSFFTMGHILRH